MRICKSVPLRSGSNKFWHKEVALLAGTEGSPKVWSRQTLFPHAVSFVMCVCTVVSVPLHLLAVG